MNGLERWTGRLTDGKMNRQSEGQVDRQDFLSSTYGHSVAIDLTDRQTDLLMDRWISRQTIKWKGRQTEVKMNCQIDGWTEGQMDGWISTQTDK